MATCSGAVKGLGVGLRRSPSVRGLALPALLSASHPASARVISALVTVSVHRSSPAIISQRSLVRFSASSAEPATAEGQPASGPSGLSSLLWLTRLVLGAALVAIIVAAASWLLPVGGVANPQAATLLLEPSSSLAANVGRLAALTKQQAVILAAGVWMFMCTAAAPLLTQHAPAPASPRPLTEAAPESVSTPSQATPATIASAAAAAPALAPPSPVAPAASASVPTPSKATPITKVPVAAASAPAPAPAPSKVTSGSMNSAGAGLSTEQPRSLGSWPGAPVPCKTPAPQPTPVTMSASKAAPAPQPAVAAKPAPPTPAAAEAAPPTPLTKKKKNPVPEAKAAPPTPLKIKPPTSAPAAKPAPAPAAAARAAPPTPLTIKSPALAAAAKPAPPAPTKPAPAPAMAAKPAPAAPAKPVPSIAPGSGPSQAGQAWYSVTGLSDGSQLYKFFGTSMPSAADLKIPGGSPEPSMSVAPPPKVLNLDRDREGSPPPAASGKAPTVVSDRSPEPRQPTPETTASGSKEKKGRPFSRSPSPRDNQLAQPIIAGVATVLGIWERATSPKPSANGNGTGRGKSADAQGGDGKLGGLETGVAAALVLATAFLAASTV